MGVCGTDNCRDFHTTAQSAADCCIPPSNTTTPSPSCTGQSTDWACCSSSSPCQLGGGDCDSDSHCAGNLVCGTDTCRDFHTTAQNAADCWIQPSNTTTPIKKLDANKTLVSVTSLKQSYCN